MDTGLIIALCGTLIVAVLLIVFNSVSSDAAKYKKTLEYVRFDTEEILTEELLKKRLHLVQLDGYWDKIEPLLQREIVLKINSCSEEEINPSDSKVGGCPYISSQIEIDNGWMFIAQINCKEIKPLDKENIFPTDGILYFFLDPSRLADKTKDSVKILYFQVIHNLGINTSILSLPNVQSGKLQFFEGVSLPQYDTDVVKNMLKDYEIDGYFKATNREQSHKMGGYPDTITQDFLFDKDKILLLQLDSDQNNGLLWGNMGRLYIFADRQSVLSCTFDKIYSYIQSYEEKE